jgi:hypothetical protein
MQSTEELRDAHQPRQSNDSSISRMLVQPIEEQSYDPADVSFNE